MKTCEQDFREVELARMTDVELENDDEKFWYDAHRSFLMALIELESQMRWALTTATVRDYSNLLVTGFDGALRGMAKLAAAKEAK